MKLEKYLQIGSVVLLDGGETKVMITGFVASAEDENEVYDYIGCIYPEGVTDTEENLLFNHDQIVQIYHLGLIDDDEIIYKNALEETMNEIDNENDNEVENIIEPNISQPEMTQGGATEPVTIKPVMENFNTGNSFFED